jgi:hypothetical protein
MKKLLMVAVSAFALSFAGNVYANGIDIDADLLTGNGNDGNKGSVVGNDNDHNKVNSGNEDSSKSASHNSVDDGSAGVNGNGNDGNVNLVVDDIDIHVKVDASKRIAKSESYLLGVVAHNKTNNGGANVNLALGAKQAAGNSIRTGGVSQCGGFEAGINAQQAATGVNTLNQAQVQVSAQASFTGIFPRQRVI